MISYKKLQEVTISYYKLQSTEWMVGEWCAKKSAHPNVHKEKCHAGYVRGLRGVSLHMF